MYDYDAEVAHWPEVSEEQRGKLATLLRPGVSDHIKQLVDAAPPLTSEQRDRLAVVLRPAAEPKRAEPAPKPALGDRVQQLVSRMSGGAA